MGVAEYVANVDRLLTRAHGLYSPAGDVVVGGGGGSVPAPPAGSSALRTGAGAAGGVYQQSQFGLAGLDAESGELAGEGGAIAAQGSAGSGAIRDAARSQAAAIAPLAKSPAGMRLLVATMDQHVAAMGDQLHTTTAENQALTARLQQVVAGYRKLNGLPSVPGDGTDAPDDDPSRRRRDPTIRAANWHPGDPIPPQPPQRGQPPDPVNRRIGDPRFGQWEDVPLPPPHTTPKPPPLQPEYRPSTDPKVGPSTGIYVPGKTWIGDIDPPIVEGQEEYRFRVAGNKATTTTRMVFENGQWHEQRWVQNVYEYQRNTSLVPGGDLGGLPPLLNIDRNWKPITLGELGLLSVRNPDVTYYLPDASGGVVKFLNGVPLGSSGLPSEPPSMIRPR